MIGMKMLLIKGIYRFIKIINTVTKELLTLIKIIYLHPIEKLWIKRVFLTGNI